MIAKAKAKAKASEGPGISVLHEVMFLPCLHKFTWSILKLHVIRVLPFIMLPIRKGPVLSFTILEFGRTAFPY